MARFPYVIERGEKGEERAYDIYSRLLKDRIVFISGEFNEDLADSVVGQLLFLESDDRESDIYMYINSPGGALNSMYAIYDTMNYISPDIVTVGFGTVMSAGSFILAAGTPGKRHALPNTNIMIHELSTGTEGKIGDIQNYLKHVDRRYETMANHYAQFTGQPVEKIKEDMRKDYFMSPEEAKEYGLIDTVQERRS